jgi:hypothetical protein
MNNQCTSECKDLFFCKITEHNCSLGSSHWDMMESATGGDADAAITDASETLVAGTMTEAGAAATGGDADAAITAASETLVAGTMTEAGAAAPLTAAPLTAAPVSKAVAYPSAASKKTQQTKKPKGSGSKQKKKNKTLSSEDVPRSIYKRRSDDTDTDTSTSDSCYYGTFHKRKPEPESTSK